MRLLAVFIVVFFELYAKEASHKVLFTKEMILPYLVQENPFVYETSAKESVYKEKERYYLGDFDTKISAKYDKKEYPVSEGEFLDLSIEKPIENGMEFIAGYREATGVQEYNNIKTGEEGEVRVGVKMPIVGILNDMSTRKLHLNLASLDTAKLSFESQDNLRLLHFEVLSSYYKVLYFQAILKLEEALLSAAKERESIIKKRVASGALPDVALLEAAQQIISATQRRMSAYNDFSNALESFLQYLNLSTERFEALYTLGDMPQMRKNEHEIYSAIEEALSNRPDLKVYDYEIKKMAQHEQHSALLKHPDMNVALYGVHDFEYESGFKVSLDMKFPIERRKYEGKSGEIKMSVLQIQNSKNKKIITIKTNLTNSINTLKTIETNIESADTEVLMVEQLQEVENKKYKLGQSNLFMLNQREMYTLETKKKRLKYILEYFLTSEAINKELSAIEF